jgi:regulator of nucleoside diphosphate kinase
MGSYAMKTRTLIVTQKDKERLQALMFDNRTDIQSRPYFKALKQELEHAQVVDSKDIPADVVTMNSTVKVRPEGSKRTQTFTVVYPEHADIDEDKISILAPIGTALLGYREGDEVEWEVPAGKRKFTIEKVTYQPEAAGDLDA